MRFWNSVIPAIAFAGVLLGAGAQAAGLNIRPDAGAMLRPIHGFHCRPEKGWDPLAGYYRLHHHEKICRDYRRCLTAYQKCQRMFGRDYTDRRFTQCMFEFDCY